MLHKFLVQVPAWCLVILLAIFQQWSCLPNSSKEIDKARTRDNKGGELLKNHDKKLDNLKKKLVETKNELDGLTGIPPLINSSNQVELTRICRKFIQEEYIPYLKALEDYRAQLEKYATDPSKKRERTSDLQNVRGHLLYVKNLLGKNKANKLYNFFIKRYDQFHPDKT